MSFEDVTEQAGLNGHTVCLTALFFTLSAGKRGVYLLPIFPALALLAAWPSERWIRSARDAVGLVSTRRAVAIVGSVAAIEWLALGLVLVIYGLLRMRGASKRD